MQELFTLADKLRQLREKKDAQAAALKDTNTEIESTEYKLTEAMAQAECSNFTRNGKQFIMTTITRWSPETDRKDELYAILKKKGYDHMFSVNSQLLASFIREQVNETADDNGDTHIPDWLDGFVKSYDSIGITMRAASKKS